MRALNWPGGVASVGETENFALAMADLANVIYINCRQHSGVLVFECANLPCPVPAIGLRNRLRRGPSVKLDTNLTPLNLEAIAAV